MGLPVVSTDVGAVSGVLAHEETGLLVPAGDAAALAAAMGRLAADRGLRARMGRAGRAAALGRHSNATMLAEIDRIYRGRTGGGTRPRQPSDLPA